MLPKWHALLGLIFSVLLVMLFNISFFSATVVFLAAVFIDIDHYLFYVYKTGDWNLKKSVSWYFKNADLFEKMSQKERRKIYAGLCFLHGIEAIIVLLILSFLFKQWSVLFLSIICGFIFHQLLDAIDLYRERYDFDKVVSFIYSLKNSKNKKLLQEIKDGRK